MSIRPASAHPLDTDLLDFVEGVADRAVASNIEAHLAGCVVCRIKRQRLSGAPPMDFVDPTTVVSPTFERLTTEDEVPENAKPGQLWLTTGEEPALVLVRSVRQSGDGVVVVPVALDLEVADDAVRVLDGSASPLPVPIAIWDTLVVSLPVTALAERVATRGDVDVSDVGATGPGVSRGTALEGPADPRHEVRQYLLDRLTALETYDDEDPTDSADELSPTRRFETVKNEFEWRRPWCDVQRLGPLPVHPDIAESWVGICRIVDFTTHVAVVQTNSRLSTARDFDQAQALFVRLNVSALAVCTASTDVADIYDPPSLFGAIELPEGTRSAGPLISGLSLVDALDKYLGQKQVLLSTIAGPTQHAPTIDVAAVLGSAVEAAVDQTAGRAPRLRDEKRSGYEQLTPWKQQLARTLRRALEPDFDPAVIERLIDEGKP